MWKKKKHSVAFTVPRWIYDQQGKAWLILLGRLLFIKNPTEQIYIWLKKTNCIKMSVSQIKPASSWDNVDACIAEAVEVKCYRLEKTH